MSAASIGACTTTISHRFATTHNEETHVHAAPHFRPSAIALALAALAGAAAAQQTPPAADKADAKKEEAQVITVTATRRVERLQDVPLSVSTANSQQIESSGVRSVADISKLVSGVTFGESPQDAGFRVRGVGTLGGFTSASELPVGVVIDGVVMGLGPLLESMVDVDRIEALKGPQGTQFGKNASSGVVSITTRRPRLGKLEGEASFSFGSLGEKEVTGVLNVPISDTMAARVAVFGRKFDGYLDNVTRNEKWGGVEANGAKAQLLVKPNADLDLLFSADMTRRELTGPGQLWTLRRPPPFGYTPTAGITPSADGLSAEVNYRFGGYTLTSVTARRNRDVRARFGLDVRPLSIFEAATDKEFNQDSQELRLTSPRGTFEYVAGVFWSKLKADTQDSAWLQPALLGAPAPPGLFVNLTNGINRTQTTTTSTALFADGKFKFSDTLALLAGIRATRDEARAENTAVTSGQLAILGAPPGFLLPATPRPAQVGETSATKPSGRLGLEFKASPDLLLYATAARGYLGPTVTFSGTNGTRTDVKPQSVNDLTAGFKAQFMERRVTFNGSVFYDKYRNLQVGVFDGVEFLTQNAGGMTSKGFELDGSVRVAGGVRAYASLTYADAKFTDFVTDCPDTGDPARCFTVGGVSLFQGKGEPLPGAPKVTGVIGIDYSVLLDSGYAIDANVNASFRSKTSYGVGEVDHVQDSYSVVNAALKFSPDSDKWYVGLWARNLFDKRYQSAIIGLPFAAPGGIVNWNTRDARRTIGMTVGAKF
jgi:iron complex outermembrane recepter protein